MKEQSEEESSDRGITPEIDAETAARLDAELDAWSSGDEKATTTPSTAAPAA